MSDCIDREAVVDEVNDWYAECCGEFDEAEDYIDLLLDYVNGIPAADVAPIIRAKWVLRSGTVSRYECSNCQFDGPEYVKFYEHCPHCGARMDEEGSQ